jgi:GNAT superfamily N-acetyltransferase
MNDLLGPIRKLEVVDAVDDFDCGSDPLNQYLRRHAWMNQRANGAQTYVAPAGATLAGYYSLSVGSVAPADAPGRVAKGLARHPIPVMLISRLAVDKRFQRMGVGSALLKDALLRTLQAAGIAGIRALLVHPKDHGAEAWYRRFGFEPGPAAPTHMFLLLKDIERAANAPAENGGR